MDTYDPEKISIEKENKRSEIFLDVVKQLDQIKKIYGEERFVIEVLPLLYYYSEF